MQPYRVALPFLLMTLLASGCGPGGDQDGGQDQAGPDSLATGGPADRQVVKVGGKLFGIPSPAQTMLLLKRSGKTYQKDGALPLDLAEKLTTRTTRGLALGAYGADLAYATAFQDGQKALSTLIAVEKIGQDLGLASAFDRTLVEKFKTNLMHEDSLLRLSGTAYRAADEYLKSDQQEDLSALVLAGGWVESMYLSLAGLDKGIPEALKDRIGQQQRTIQGLIGLLSAHSAAEGVPALLDAFRKLDALYQGIQVTYQFEQPVTEPAKRTTYINGTSSANVTDEHLRSIADQISALRAQIKA
ncbi:MAG: hypothetical protein JNM31_12710 [Flavobacteriales bacterium]|nr:hypothetical protein [Flavobacteriales bacterium]